MSLLRFEGGPADGQEIHLGVPPPSRRWFCQFPDTGESWWRIDERPPEDHPLVITEYVLADSRANENYDETVHTYRPIDL